MLTQIGLNCFPVHLLGHNVINLEGSGIVILRHLAVFAVMASPIPDNPTQCGRDAHEAACLIEIRARDCSMPSKLLTRSKLFASSRSLSVNSPDRALSASSCIRCRWGPEKPRERMASAAWGVSAPSKLARIVSSWFQWLSSYQHSITAQWGCSKADVHKRVSHRKRTGDLRF